MGRGSVKPFGKSYENFLNRAQEFRIPLKPDDNGSFTLEPKKTYVFKLERQLGPEVRKSGKLYGQATAKSSVGRVDVLARLIVDGMDSYEAFNPQGVAEGNGHLYLEITPITFSVRVKKGISLSQLRIFYGKPEDAEIHSDELYASVLLNGGHDGCLRVDLEDAQVGDDKGCAFCAPPNKKLDPVSLWINEGDKPIDPGPYWELQRAINLDEMRSLPIVKEQFYLLRSKERIALPNSVSVYCRAIDETIGEMRIHYAGFVHPFFGREGDSKGTPLIFEVRGHDVEVLLTDCEKMARLTFYRMSEECAPDEKKSQYGSQTLKLSKFFGPWAKQKNKTPIAVENR
jgi:dCTP deaminase